MKKKIMSVLIAAVMVLSMTACSSKDEPQTPEAIEEEKQQLKNLIRRLGKTLMQM
ncbi:hypothetical protein [[Ruminococcus] torques]|uniref:hypothetical protein n=1 Tax=[Ruminococcus] torques TaxID=33039 RepID=UPI0025A496C9|nr:hypothetical protein [[Ruminococcus] torques]MDM8235439.1 hypothetical protein [[Ruminococcus] torques]